jgi:GAF domain
MELRDLITDAPFRARASKNRDPRQAWETLRRLARIFAETPEAALQSLVDIAVESTGADSAGISLEETTDTGAKRFRWIAISGTFAEYLHGTTPRFFSPCGTCLDAGRPQLYSVTKAYYDFLGVTADPITDGILIPWISGSTRGTIWLVSHQPGEAFDYDDYRLLESLADFAAIAIQNQARESRLVHRERRAASVNKANELGHKINNPLQRLTNTLYLAQRGGPEATEYLNQASLDLADLAATVGNLLNLKTPRP